MELRAARRLTLAQARRVALRAQGFGGDRDADLSASPVGMRDVQRLITRLGQFQIDTINVVERAHYLPVYSRLGPYDRGLVDRAAYRAPRRLFEYWGHAASLIDVTLEPALRWRMAAHLEQMWPGIARIDQDHPGLVDAVVADVAERGPIGARAIEYAEQRQRDGWGWNWSAVKTALEYQLWAGRVHAARRNTQFERLYDLPERVIPPAVFNQPTPDREDALRTLVVRAAQALGVGSLKCLSDYFRTHQGQTRQAVDGLVDAGLLIPVQVGDRPEPWWLWHQASVPRRVGSTDAGTLVSPFDSLIFERRRLETLFGFHYRIEIYVPEPKREYGYYVYPFLLGEEFVARVDLKAHRADGVLRVKAAWSEVTATQPPDVVAGALLDELSRMARWLGLERVEVDRRGDLAAHLLAGQGPAGRRLAGQGPREP